MRAVSTIGAGLLLASGLAWADDSPLSPNDRARLAQSLQADVRRWGAVLESDPKNLEAYSRRGDARFFLGDFQGAVRDYDRMVELEPARAAEHWRRGIACYCAGRYDQAARQFELYHTQDNVDRENGIWRFLSQAKASGMAKAREGLLAYEKDDREPFPGLYRLFAGKERPEEIVAEIRRAPIDEEEREKRLFYAHLYLGFYWNVVGNLDEATRSLRGAVASAWGPKGGFGPNFMWHVGRVHLEALGRERDWPRWRGWEGNAVSRESPFPVSWSLSRGVAWRVPVAGEGSSSPIVWGDAVFLTSSLDHGGRRLLLCLDRKTGETRWQREVQDPNPERTSALAGHAASTPATDGTRVVAFFGNAGVIAWDLEGRELWRRSLGDFDTELGLASSPLFSQDRVILQCDHDGDRFRSFDSYLIALEAATGRTRWKTERRGLERSWSTPIVVTAGDREELVVCGQDGIRAYDPDTGSALWHSAGPTGWVAPSPVSGMGLLFAGSGKDGPILGVRPGGAGDPQADRVVWKEERGGPYVCSPLLYGDLLYIHDEQGHLSCREAKTGKLVYRETLSGKFTASPVGADGKIYITSESGTTFVLRAGREFEVLARNELGEECLASPALSRGALFLRTRRHLACIARPSEK
jgi:outer membrane protein assembly factor BamB